MKAPTELLLEWYARNRRALPWRQCGDPYGVWLSEIMLQQTTVRTVEPRWRRFLARFPNVRALAAAPVDDILNEWSGLGYYARARNLHAAAQRIVHDFGGKFPREFEALLALPGMGKYTAAAVASIAFGEPVAVVDANVERVLARFDAIDDDVTQPRTKRILWDRAQELLPRDKPGDWNQAMMELGALVCLPRAPQCPACPLAKHCRARATGEPERFPIKKSKPPMQDAREVAAIIRKNGRLLVLRRAANGSFAGMWELPRGVAHPDESSSDAVPRVVRELTGAKVGPGRLLMRFKHTVMRTSIRLTVWEVESKINKPRLTAHEEYEWLSPHEWLTRPISTTQRRIAETLLNNI